MKFSLERLCWVSEVAQSVNVLVAYNNMHVSCSTHRHTVIIMCKILKGYVIVILKSSSYSICQPCPSFQFEPSDCLCVWSCVALCTVRCLIFWPLCLSTSSYIFSVMTAKTTFQYCPVSPEGTVFSVESQWCSVISYEQGLLMTVSLFLVTVIQWVVHSSRLLHRLRSESFILLAWVVPFINGYTWIP